MNIRNLAPTEEVVLTTCPVLLDDGLTECGEALEVVWSRDIVGDDYGSWTEHDVSFRCGHGLRQMESSLKMIHLGAV